MDTSVIYQAEAYREDFRGSKNEEDHDKDGAINIDARIEPIPEVGGAPRLQTRCCAERLFLYYSGKLLLFLGNYLQEFRRISWD